LNGVLPIDFTPIVIEATVCITPTRARRRRLTIAWIFASPSWMTFLRIPTESSTRRFQAVAALL
jgi:hypothetical protein